jgi:hypothetical protein
LTGFARCVSSISAALSSKSSGSSAWSLPSALPEFQTYQALKAYGSSPSPNFLAPKLEPTGGPFFLCHLSYAVNTFGGLEGPASGMLAGVSMVVVILLVVLIAMHLLIVLLSI